MRKIETKIAYGYIKQYETTMKNLDIDKPEKGFTKSVGFNKKELQDWLQNLGPETTEIKICFGIYPPTLSKNTRAKSRVGSEGRFTAILWPYNENGEAAIDDEGNEELPVNVGELEP